MADQLNIPRTAGGRSLFIEGYFADRVWRGEQPKYGYPAPATFLRPPFPPWKWRRAFEDVAA